MQLHRTTYSTPRAASAVAIGFAAAIAAAQPCRVWTEMTPNDHPSARAGHAMAYDAFRAYTLLWGGVGGGPQGDTWSWDGTNWTQRATTGPQPRAGYQMAYDSSRQKMVLTGNPQSAFLLDTWEWDGTGWNLVKAGGPSARA